MRTLITCHANADCDAFAAMLAARRLYDNADLLFPGSLEAPLNRIYNNIDKREFSFVEPHAINWDDYDRLVVVDTRQASRIKHVAQLLKKDDLAIEAWDHHPSTSEDIRSAPLHYALTGSVTSLLCSELQNRGISLSPKEATLLGLGIYADTGSFTYSSTTDADFHAAAWLLGQGMQVSELSDMACQELTSMQVKALSSLLESAKVYNINGTDVVLAEVDLEHYLGDFAFLAHKVMEMEKFDVLFAIARMADRIQVVARSRSNAINVGEICADLGGGGHIYAASASIRFKSLAQIRDAILRLLHEHAQPEKTAGSYMTSPAIGVEAQATLHEADELMLHFGLKAIPVFKPGTHVCQGILDAQTAARANAHGLGKEPVAEYMKRHIEMLAPSATLGELATIIVGGRQRLVPIIKDENVIGVVTRTDLINVFANECSSLAAIKKKNSKVFSVTKLLRDRLPGTTVTLLKLAGELGTKLGLPVYVVGGFVRDLLIGRSNHDIDLVAEGNGIALARALARELNGRVREHQKFLTSVVVYQDEKGEERHIDVATARLEYYEYPAALPTVELSSIKMDLFRRDFSINALAVRLDGQYFGNLEDFFGGKNDIKDGLIRVLHTLSFVEDPTRCIRAARFEQRYGFRIGAGTEKLIKNILPMGLLQKLSSTRLFNEFRHLCDEEKAAACIFRLESLGILKALGENLALTPAKKTTLTRTQELLAWHKLLFFEKSPQAWICYFFCLSHGLNYADAARNYKSLGLPANKKNQIMRQREIVRGLASRLEEWQAAYDQGDASISQFCQLLRPLTLESQLYIMATSDLPGLEKMISRYITQWSKEKPDIKGDDLLKAGVTPGPAIGLLLQEALEAKLDGIAPTASSQLECALTHWRKTISRKVNA